MHGGPVSATPSVQTAATQSDDGDDFFSFDTLLDIVNPLQHLPVVGTLYRAITGDKMNVGAKLAGDGLYGGPMGLLGSVADTLFEKITGKNVGDTVLAFLTGDDGPNTVPTNVAENKPATAPIKPDPSEMKVDASAYLPGADALDAALAARGFDGELALRARQAYQRTLSMDGNASGGMTS